MKKHFSFYSPTFTPESSIMSMEDILSRYDERTGRLVRKLRKFLLKEIRDCIEMPDTKASLIGYGYGTGYKDLVCTLLISGNGIKLGFNRGSELPDPERLLKGSGKVHRYAELKNAPDIKSPALKKLITEALKAYTLRRTTDI